MTFLPQWKAWWGEMIGTLLNDNLTKALEEHANPLHNSSLHRPVLSLGSLALMGKVFFLWTFYSCAFTALKQGMSKFDTTLAITME